MQSLYILYLFFSLPVTIECRSKKLLTIGTYNLWNVMFNWDVRKYYIAKMIRESDLDVIGFQEVRFDSSTGNNQVRELQKLLPEYPYAAFHPASRVTLNEDSYWTSWDSEGLGLLSKLPLTHSQIQRLPLIQHLDSNERIALHTKVRMEEAHLDVNIVTVHLSYARQAQCAQAAAIIQEVERQYSAMVIVLGDFNAYQDFEFPTRMFIDKSRIPVMCRSRKFDLSSQQRRLTFLDVGSPDQFTFSNMPIPGLVSRPDRIMVSSDIAVRPNSVLVRGDGQDYKTRYKSSIRLHRLRTLLLASRLTALGATGYPCLHTCGPRGVCRCGVCITRQGHNSTRDCKLPDCEECSAGTLVRFGALLAVGLFLAATVAFAVVRILVVSSHAQQNQRVFEILGFNCCLCHPELFEGPLAPRVCRYRSVLIRWNPLCWLTPYVSLATGLVLLLLTYILSSFVLADSLETVHSTMAEEFFPSDHLMLSASLELVPEDVRLHLS